MKDENCEVLFEYLRSILYDQQIQTPDISQLDEQYQKLGKGMQVLQRMVEEMQQYAADLATGNLTGLYPPRDNFLCRNLKNLHANVNHLTWQAKQVAAGDYSQYVSYLGDFSEAFNTMIAQLKEREQTLKEEAEREKNRAIAMEGYNELLIELTKQHYEWIIVVEKESGRVLYCNQTIEHCDADGCDQCWKRLEMRKGEVEWQSGETERVREVRDSHGHFYRISTIEVEWRGCWAYAHIIADITREKQEAQFMAAKAYNDALTGIQNRRFFEEVMGQLLADRSWFTLCYMDLDNLKQVNDNQGHAEGDRYIVSFIRAVQQRIRESDMFMRIGGDEFCLIFRNCHADVVRQKMQKILDEFRVSGEGSYHPSFSFGLVEVSGGEAHSMEEILACADERMYEFKRKYKKLL